MHHDYADIRDLIPTPPLWWDEHAVPRYVPFAPDRIANIYGSEAILLLIACQRCKTEFQVAMSCDIGLSRAMGHATLSKRITAPPDQCNSALHYGDPPNIWCCAGGPTMNCIDLRVLEYWHREHPLRDWTRDPALEIEIERLEDYE